MPPATVTAWLRLMVSVTMCPALRSPSLGSAVIDVTIGAELAATASPWLADAGFPAASETAAVTW